MKKYLSLLLSFLLPMAVAMGTVEVYPITPGDNPSALFSVTVNGVDVPVVENTRHYAHFGMDEPVVIRVTGVAGWSIGPENLDIVPTWDGNVMEFTLEQPAKLAIHNNYNTTPLLIFADPIEVNPPAPGDPDVLDVATLGTVGNGENATLAIGLGLGMVAADPTLKYLYVGPGLYPTKTIQMPSNAILYLAPGTKLVYAGGSVDGIVSFVDVSNSGLIGRGVLEGNFGIASAIWFNYADGIFIEGVVCRNTKWYNTHIVASQNVEIQNIKVMNRGLN
jgi:hypothetical protein